MGEGGTHQGTRCWEAGSTQDKPWSKKSSLMTYKEDNETEGSRNFFGAQASGVECGGARQGAEMVELPG